MHISDFLRSRAPRWTAASACLVAAACATNPVTRQSQLMLITTSQEIQIGQKAAQEVNAEYGLYKDLPGLTAYVNGVGQKLVAQCQRRDVAYHFQVLDSPVINAFALPGGYIYVTRGILARMNSEDELAAVLGHELTHVAARHGAAEMSKAYAAQVGLAAASILEPNLARSLGGLVDSSLQLAFLGYSRGLEAQADEYGITYIERAGYNPRGATKMFQMFLSLEESEPGTMERFLMSHPPTRERLAYAQERIGEAERSAPGLLDRPLKREAFIERVNGMTLGQGSGEKVLVGGTYTDKKNGAAFDVPDVFSADLRPKEGEATFVRLEKLGGQAHRLVVGFEVQPLARSKSAAQYGEGYIGRIKVPHRQREAATLALAGGQRMETRIVDLTSQDVALRAIMGFTVREGKAYVLYGYSDSGSFPSASTQFQRILASLRFPAQAELARVQPPRLRVARVAAGGTWASLCQREYGKSGLAARLAAYNGIFDPGRQPEPGLMIKLPDAASLKERM